jgi:hypothetical protein
MKAFVYILLIALLMGCATEKRCLKKYPPQLERDTTVESVVVYDDTIIYVRIPGDTTINEVTILMPSPRPKIEPVTAEVSLAWAEARVMEDKLRLTLVQKDSILEFKLDSAIRASSDTIRIKDIRIIEQKVQPKWFAFFRAGFWILGVLMILTILFLVLRK